MRHYLPEHETDWDTYLLILRYAHSQQVHGSIAVQNYSLAFRKTPLELAKVVPNLVSLESESNITSPVWLRVELIKRTTDLRQKADKNRTLVQRLYTMDYERLVRLLPIFLIGDYCFLDYLALFHTAAKRSNAEGYKKILPVCKDPTGWFTHS